jgi:hypothetical protein
MIPILIAIMLYVIFTVNTVISNSAQVSQLGYKTEYFHLSDGNSKEMFIKMKNYGLPQERLKEFIMLEDNFLRIEQESVCKGVSMKYEGFAVSDKIKSKFIGYDFSYHTIHLKQIAEPTKLINRNITC